MLLERLRDSLNGNIESHPQTQDEHHLGINNRKVDPENQDNSSLISSITSSTPAPSPSSDVDVYGQHFISSEHAYQWKFTSRI